MYLSYWGCLLNQEEIRRVVRPNPEDKHAGPQELADVAKAQGLEAVVRINGSEDLLRSLVANGLPVMVSTWHEDKPNDGMGHYRLVVGYDAAAREWLLYDSLAATAAVRSAPYHPLRLAYDAFAPWWEVFNHRYIVVYAKEQSAVVQAILAADLDDQAMWEGALKRAQADLAADDGNPFHWFNLGTDLVALNRHAEAASAYDRARQLGLPWRMLWYQFGPFPAYYHVGRYDEVIALADATLAVTQHVEELHYWRAMALAAKGETPSARAALERALKLRPDYPEAAKALQELGG
jgi:tetratricopeptide (TPR) repeat protein